MANLQALNVLNVKIHLGNAIILLVPDFPDED